LNISAISSAVIAFDLHILLCPVSCPLFGGGCKQSVITGIRKLCRQRITGGGNDVRVRCAALLTVDRKRQVTACVVAGQLFDAQRLTLCQPERVAPHKAAALNDRQRLGGFCAEFVQAVYTDRHIALIRMGHKAQDATGQHPHFALHTVLRSGIAVAGRDTAIDDQLDILIRQILIRSVILHKYRFLSARLVLFSIPHLPICTQVPERLFPGEKFFPGFSLYMV